MEESRVQLFPPQRPEGFRPAGEVSAAYFSLPPAIVKQRYTGSRLLGVKYEKKVQEHLSQLYGEAYLANPWFCFWAGGRKRWCQPDGLLLDFIAGTITIVEVKYQHTALAWWQTTQLYLPVLRKLFPERLWRFCFCEVTKWFDPAVQFPVEIVLAREINQRSLKFMVHIWKP